MQTDPPRELEDEDTGSIEAEITTNTESWGHRKSLHCHKDEVLDKDRQKNLGIVGLSGISKMTLKM